MTLAWMQLLQLADSALPVGATSHSFGIETMTDAGELQAGDLQKFVTMYLHDPVLMELVFCRAAHRISAHSDELRSFNALVSARKPARESRNASLAMGRRLWTLLQGCDPALAPDHFDEVHYAVAFGTLAARAGIEEDLCAMGFAEQSLASLLSTLIRLLPLGHSAAQQLRWTMKESLLDVLESSRDHTPWEVPSFTPALEIASMQHPWLATRLFIS